MVCVQTTRSDFMVHILRIGFNLNQQDGHILSYCIFYPIYGILVVRYVLYMVVKLTNENINFNIMLNIIYEHPMDDLFMENHYIFSAFMSILFIVCMSMHYYLCRGFCKLCLNLNNSDSINLI